MTLPRTAQWMTLRVIIREYLIYYVLWLLGCIDELEQKRNSRRTSDLAQNIFAADISQYYQAKDGHKEEQDDNNSNNTADDVNSRTNNNDLALCGDRDNNQGSNDEDDESISTADAMDVITLELWPRAVQYITQNDNTYLLFEVV